VNSVWERIKNYANGTRICYDWLGEGGEVVCQELAQARADVCVKCPKNVKGGLLPKAIAWAVHEQLQLKNDLQLIVNGEKLLGKCSICDCQNKLKIWREISKIRDEETPESLSKFPTWCWVVNEP